MRCAEVQDEMDTLRKLHGTAWKHTLSGNWYGTCFCTHRLIQSEEMVSHFFLRIAHIIQNTLKMNVFETNQDDTNNALFLLYSNDSLKYEQPLFLWGKPSISWRQEAISDIGDSYVILTHFTENLDNTNNNLTLAYTCNTDTTPLRYFHICWQFFFTLTHSSRRPIL
jgi:hypothetical protein